MNTSVYIAKRYLFSRKTTHAINIISGISMLGVLIGSAALIIILSAFDGLEREILKLYSNFSPQIKIEAKQGKTFNPNTAYFNELRKNTGIFSFSEVLEEKALARYGDKQVPTTIKGVSDDFLKNKNLDSTIHQGAFSLTDDYGRPAVVIGSMVQNSLGVNIGDKLMPLEIYSPRRTAAINSIDPTNDFVVKYIYPSGVFSIQQDFDNIIVAPLAFTRELLDQPVEVSAIEINLKSGANADDLQQAIKDKIGADFNVRNRAEQNALLYKILHSEKWAVYLILTFVVIIATFNIVGSLTMLVMDKRKDIAILSSLGASRRLIQGIFFCEGMLITLIGCVSGMLLALIFCVLQQKFGMIKIGSNYTTMDAYPIALKFTDFVLVFITVMGISVIAAGISARVSVKGLEDIKQDL
ncbi:ABC transporter permease [Mucilaginibacter sp. AW1-3]